MEVPIIFSQYSKKQLLSAEVRIPSVNVFILLHLLFATESFMLFLMV
jgi:hypothetical protein